uniref:Zgc:172121 n=1 Tax=Hucho hucho TaxID=62062 RepID=A0A4W5PWA5_9TELE
MAKTDVLKPLMDVGPGPLIVDGGLATELESAGCKLQGDPLWSARLLHTNPQAIKDAHYRFLCAGADVITTATYQASVEGFTRHLDITPEQANQLIMSGVTLARDTVKHFMADQPPSDRRVPLVAGSVGPYGAFLHNGSEYTGAYAAEMSVEVRQVVVLHTLYHLATHGSTFPFSQPWRKPENRISSIAELSLEWMNQGSAFIGGCCRISPAHIAELRRQIYGNVSGSDASQRGQERPYRE